MCRVSLSLSALSSPPPHLLSFGPAADLQSLALTDGHLESEGDPDVSQILGPRVDGEALHAAHILPAAETHNTKQPRRGEKKSLQTLKTVRAMIELEEQMVSTTWSQRRGSGSVTILNSRTICKQ